MKIKLIQACFLLFSGAVFGQSGLKLKQSSTSHDVEKCSQHIRTQQMQQDDPARFATIGKRNIVPQQERYSPAVQEKATGVIYTIPVVFHILHNGGTSNISDAQIQDQLGLLGLSRIPERATGQRDRAVAYSCPALGHRPRTARSTTATASTSTCARSRAMWAGRVWAR